MGVVQARTKVGKNESEHEWFDANGINTLIDISTQQLTSILRRRDNTRLSSLSIFMSLSLSDLNISFVILDRNSSRKLYYRGKELQK